MKNTPITAQTVVPVGFKFYERSIQANSPGWVSTGISINQNDFVIFEAFGEVILGNTIVAKSRADGVVNPLALFFNRYRSTRHGNLFCKNGEKTIEAESKQSLSLLLEPFENLYWKSMEADFTGNFFIASSVEELKFAINDRDFKNNEGYFTVKITVIPYIIHQDRNSHNRCPTKRPERCSEIQKSKEIRKYPFDDSYLCIDHVGEQWIKADHEWYFHGGGFSNLYSYETFRGNEGSVKGCQCTYDNQGKIVSDGYQGTFDFAFSGLPGLTNQMKFHTLWDVIPHEYFLKHFSQGEPFQYRTTKTY
jgi:hypothetical protein